MYFVREILFSFLYSLESLSIASESKKNFGVFYFEYYDGDGDFYVKVKWTVFNFFIKNLKDDAASHY